MIRQLKRWIYEMAAQSSTGQSAVMLVHENEGFRRANNILAKRADVFYAALLSARLTIEREHEGLESHEIAYQSFAYAVILAALGENEGRPLAAYESNLAKKCILSDIAEASFEAAKTGKAAQDIYLAMQLDGLNQGEEPKINYALKWQTYALEVRKDNIELNKINYELRKRLTNLEREHG